MTAVPLPVVTGAAKPGGMHFIPKLDPRVIKPDGVIGPAGVRPG